MATPALRQFQLEYRSVTGGQLENAIADADTGTAWSDTDTYLLGTYYS